MASRAQAKYEESLAGPGKRTPGHGISEEDWIRVELLILRGHAFTAVGRMTGLNERTVRRLFHEGYPSQPWGQTPIKVKLAAEQAKARAQLVARKEVKPTPAEAEELARVEGLIGAATLPERVAAKSDALEARTAEAQLVRIARGNVTALAGAAVGLLKPATALAREVGRLVLADVDASARSEKTIAPDAALGLLRDCARFMKDIVETGHKAMEMERLLLGDPSGSGKTVRDADNMTIDDALVELTNGAKVLAGLEAKGLRVIQGGKSPAGGGEGEPAAEPSPSPAEAAPAAPGGEGQAFDASTSRTAVGNPRESVALPSEVSPDDPDRQPAGSE